MSIIKHFLYCMHSFNEAPIKTAKNHIHTTDHTQEIMTNV